jgi:DNA-binding NtrC family response regulator
MSEQLDQLLLIDDDAEAAASLSKALRAHGLNCLMQVSSNPLKAVKQVQKIRPQVCLLDLCLDEALGVESGFKTLEQILKTDDTCRVIVLTGHGSVTHGVRALSAGASNFIQKPADVPHLVALIRDGISQANLRRNYSLLKTEKEQSLVSSLIGTSQHTEAVKKQILYAASNNQSVFITGETGTGKGFCASLIHRLSTRSSRPFIRYQPRFGTSDLINSDLFGHVKGAFTGAESERQGLISEAAGGTLFLDEIDELPIETQISLLGVLQDKVIRPVGSSKECSADFRLLAASNRCPEESLESGKIRSDFYHRVAHFRILLTPLRERPEDILPLSNHALFRLRAKENLNVFSIDDAAHEKLADYTWPGNIRELEAVIENAAYLADYEHRGVILEQDIQTHKKLSAPLKSFASQVQAFKLELIQAALKKHQGNQVKAAQDLDLDRSSMRRIMEKTEGALE